MQQGDGSRQMPSAADAAISAPLFAKLAELGIETRTLEHQAVFTVAESAHLDRALPGGHTKNLFLKDDKGALWLVVAETTTRVDLKGLAKKIGSGRLSFGKPELLAEVLGVQPGSVTAFAVMNDVTGRTRVIVDRNLAAHATVNCHPLRNTATTNIAFTELLRFLTLTGHEPAILDIQ